MASASATSVAGDGEREDHPDVVGAAAELGGDLGRGDGRIGGVSQGALEVRADGSPDPPAAAARHGEPHRVARLPPAGRPPRHPIMIT